MVGVLEKKRRRELAAIMTTISVVAIQKGPYRSGLFFMTSLKTGRSRMADLMRAEISYYSMSKYSLS